MNQPDLSWKHKIQVAGEVLLEWARAKIPYTLLVAGCFTVGYAVKNMEDEGDRARAHENLNEVERQMASACDARIIGNDKLVQQRMTERDNLLADQTARIANLTQLVQVLSNQQRTSVQLSRAQLAEIRQLNAKTPNARAIINQEVRTTK
jgi:hypothetical protein